MARLRRLPSLCVLVGACALAWPGVGRAAPAAEDAWLDALYADIATDLVAGRPLVVQVHVPLCDNHIIRCGNAKLGDGDNPATNLYWATSGGFLGWFGDHHEWHEVLRRRTPRGPVLERVVWRKTIRPTARWRALGVRKPFAVYVVAFAWRGDAIAQAIDRYVADLYGSQETAITLADGTELAAGGRAHVVAYVGHNGWMDLPAYDWARAQKKQARRRKANIAVACLTADYLAESTTDPRRVPLLMTTSLLFAGAHSFEGAVSAFAEAQPLAEIRARAAKNHALGQGKPFARVRGAFTNPSDSRWRRYVSHAAAAQ